MAESENRGSALRHSNCARRLADPKTALEIVHWEDIGLQLTADKPKLQDIKSE